MTIKHILAPVSGDRDAPHVALCALKLAEKLQAHLTATNIPLSATASFVPEAAISPGVYAGLNKALEDANAQRSARARAFFDSAVAATKTPIVDTPVCARASTTWTDITAQDDTRIATLGRLADLIVLDRPGGNDTYAESVILEDAVFEARRPVLMVPPQTQGIDVDNIAIAWNGSREAAEAVRCALDFLAPGAKITIIQIGEIHLGNTSAEALMDYLGWHCHAPTLRKITDKPKATAELLLSEAKAAGARLLVAGAYSHSRTRELLLGGVTRELLARADMPVLMAH